MSDNCPKCGGPLKCLAGKSAHPNNWFCEDEKGCGWLAWEKETSDTGKTHFADDDTLDYISKLERENQELRAQFRTHPEEWYLRLSRGDFHIVQRITDAEMMSANFPEHIGGRVVMKMYEHVKAARAKREEK